MNLDNLAIAYFKKAKARRKTLDVLMNEKSYSDVIRESQQITELILKGILRSIGIEPPKIHDVGKILVQNKNLLSIKMRSGVNKIAKYSFELRKNRELSFYGAYDVDPWEDYSLEDAKEALSWVDEIFDWSAEIMK